jgi:hypothetical protein
MRWMVLTSLALMLASGSATAQLPDVGSMGLTWDENHSQNCILSPQGEAEQHTMYLWARPSSRGMGGVSFRLNYFWDDGVVSISMTENPLITGGTLYVTIDYADYRSSFSSCQMDWTWIMKDALLISSGVEKTIRIEEHGVEHMIGIRGCNFGNPFEAAIRGTDLIIGGPCTTSATTSTWGAIKGLYR